MRKKPFKARIEAIGFTHYPGTIHFLQWAESRVCRAGEHGIENVVESFDIPFSPPKQQTNY